MKKENNIIVDLFDFPELIPENVKAVFAKYQDDILNGLTYSLLGLLLKEVEAEGYTFDYYLDAEPYNLRKK